MNRPFFQTLALTLLFSMLTATGAWADNPFSGGNGSQSTPYIIRTASDWAQLAANVNSGTTYKDTYFLMAADISIEETITSATPPR